MLDLILACGVLTENGFPFLQEKGLAPQLDLLYHSVTIADNKLLTL